MMNGLKSEHVYEKLEEIFEGVNILSFLKASREEKEKMSMSAMEAELNGIIAYMNSINQFIGFEVKGGEAPYIATALSIAARNWLGFCEKLDQKKKCEELWKLCEDSLCSEIDIAGTTASGKEDK